MRKPEFAILRRWDWMERLLGMRFAFAVFGPFLGAGIRVTRIAADYSEITVELREHFYNRNYVGAHFGGSLYSMCDPIFMFMLMKQLGPEFIVWDKSASIDFLRPGSGTVHATFTVRPDRIAAIRSEVEARRKMDAHFDVEVLNGSGETIARVHKVVYVRGRRQA